MIRHGYQSTRRKWSSHSMLYEFSPIERIRKQRERQVQRLYEEHPQVKELLEQKKKQQAESEQDA